MQWQKKNSDNFDAFSLAMIKKIFSLIHSQSLDNFAGCLRYFLEQVVQKICPYFFHPVRSVLLEKTCRYSLDYFRGYWGQLWFLKVGGNAKEIDVLASL